jgi:epoxyqueuosine reductase
VDGGGLARRLKERALEAGFAAAGIAAASPSEHGPFVRAWVRSGRAGVMDWLARSAEVRLDPRRSLPWARSALVVSASYLPYAGERGAQEGLVRHVARYAVGRDYHRVVRDRLLDIARFLRGEAPGARTQVCVDKGPILERELAARAGIGWFGKNANLIGPEGDSWIVLGVLLTDLDLPADEPAADHCGTCTACLDACPTGAIPEPYLVDATRCISYLTIELRGRIPAESRAGMGDWVFGCDVCQEVCPWNRGAGVTRDGAFRPGEHLEKRDLSGLVRLTAADYRREFRPAPLERPLRRGLVRNALIVAGNTGDEAALDAAGERLADPDPVVRSTAAWAVGRGANARRRALLERARAAESDPEVKTEMDAALDRS